MSAVEPQELRLARVSVEATMQGITETTTNATKFTDAATLWKLSRAYAAVHVAYAEAGLATEAGNVYATDQTKNREFLETRARLFREYDDVSREAEAGDPTALTEWVERFRRS